MVGIDGGVKYVPYYMRDELIKKGWKIINNPKVEYFPEFDSTLQGYQTGEEEVNDGETNLLEVKVI